MSISCKKEKQNEKIRQIKKDFLIEFGVDLFIAVRGNKDTFPKLELSVIENTINDIINKDFPNLYPQGLKTKSRKYDIVVFRYSFYKIAVDMGYTPSIIEFYSGFDRCTVIHGVATIKNLLSTRHLRTLYILNNIYYELKERFGIDADLQSDQSL